MSAGSLTAPTAARAEVLRNRVRWVVRATITYNIIEAVVGLSAGAVASSSALIGFGLDSIVEVLSAAAVAWQFAGGRNHQDREYTALRVIAFSFFALAGFVTYDALRTLAGDGAVEHSTVGIVLAAVSLALMPGLARWERRLCRELGSGSVVADSAQLSLCAALSAVLLVGLLMNSLPGWSWADPVAALVIAAVAVREGRNALCGDTCCIPAAALLVTTDADDCADAACGGRS